MLPYCREKHKHLTSPLKVTLGLCSLDNCPYVFQPVRVGKMLLLKVGGKEREN